MNSSRQKNPINSQSRSSLEGRKFRFQASSAEEAVSVIRKRLGENANVLSVKQMKNTGIKRFLQSPKLEIIVEVPKSKVIEKSEANSKKKKKFQEKDISQSTVVENKDHQKAAPSSLKSEKSTSNKTVHTNNDHIKLDTAKNKNVELMGSPSSTALWIDRCGFQEALKERILSELKPSPEIELSPNRILGDIYYWLQQNYSPKLKTSIGKRIAFLGSSGSGKTTALCKYLSAQVFSKNLSVSVFKLEGETPNTDESLSLFCEIMGTTLHRNTQMLDNNQQTIFFDTPGIDFNNPAQIQHWDHQFQEFNIDTRVLVLNASYEYPLLKKQFQQGLQMGVTHIIFTHLDETVKPGKLWSLLIPKHADLLLCVHGSSISHDFTEDNFSFLVSLTLPGIH